MPNEFEEHHKARMERRAAEDAAAEMRRTEILQRATKIPGGLTAVVGGASDKASAPGPFRGAVAPDRSFFCDATERPGPARVKRRGPQRVSQTLFGANVAHFLV